MKNERIDETDNVENDDGLGGVSAVCYCFKTLRRGETCVCHQSNGGCPPEMAISFSSNSIMHKVFLHKAPAALHQACLVRNGCAVPKTMATDAHINDSSIATSL
jgi:hypothetical protein